MGKNNSLTPAAYRALLAAAILASSMAFIDGTALNVALPSIQKDLSLTGKQLLWIVNAYMVFLSSLMLVGGSIGDYLGRRRIFIAGIVLFSLSSVFCGFAGSGNLLIAFRCLQGIGAALLVPGSLSLITALVPSATRGKAIGWWSMFSALTTVSGPVLGGWLAGQDRWRVIFFLNIPLALISLWLLIKYVPEPPVNAPEKNPDWPGALLATCMLGGWSFGLIEAGESGFSNTLVISTLSVGTLSALLFIHRQVTTEAPMLPPALFRNRNFSVGNIVTFLMYGAMGGFLFFYPLNLIQVQGYSPEFTGLTIIPFALLIALMSYFTGKIVDKTGPRFLLVIGQMLCAIGYFLFALPELTAGPSEYVSSYLFPMLFIGTGTGISVVPVTTAVMNSAPDSRSGTASGLNNTIARASQVVAISVLGGMALSVFSENVISYLQQFAPNLLDSPGLENELKNLAEASLPKSSPTKDTQLFDNAVNLSFVVVFRMAALISSILTACSTLLVYAFIRRK